MSEKKVYLMRGLPGCGKSHTARKLAAANGVICETDEYFLTQVGDDPTCYAYRDELLPQARQWNFERFIKAISADASPIVVDRGNACDRESQRYVRYALDHGYAVELQEPDSPWWQEIRLLLKDKHANRERLYQWADWLAQRSQSAHRVPVAIIRHWMEHWKHDLTIADILRNRI